MVDTTLYLFESSRVIKDEDIAKILDYPNREKRPFIVLLKPLKTPIYRQKLSDSSISEILKKCKEMENDIFKCEIALSDIEKPSLEEYLRARRYVFPDYLIAQFYTALKTKGFVILSGLSGTGKTKIALEFAELLEGGIPQLMVASGSNTKAEEEIKAIEKTIEEIGYVTYAWKPAGKAKDIEPPFILWVYDSDEKDSQYYQRVPYGLLVVKKSK